MKQTLRSLFFVTALGALVITSSCKKDDPVPIPTPTPVPTVAGYVTADTSFSILLAAVSKAGLAATLGDATKTWTVFAPTNAAFRAAGISLATIDGYTATQVTNILTPLLTYHVLTTKVLAAGVPVSDAVTTLNTKSLFASRNANGVFLNGVKVVTADVPVSNGVIHAIGSVLTPPTSTIAQIVIANTTAPTPQFTLLLAAVSRAGLAGVLSGAGKFTVFAPTDAAFIAAGAPYNTAASIATADSATVRKIVLAHVLGTNVFAGDLSATSTPTTNTANPIASTGGIQQTLTFAGTTVKISGSTMVASNIITTPPLFNILATNGVVHVIDKVLL
jgi:uncharacterized surface protein with fasciclin (FAS1) repeats